MSKRRIIVDGEVIGGLLTAAPIVIIGYILAPDYIQLLAKVLGGFLSFFCWAGFSYWIGMKIEKKVNGNVK